ncbi:MAG: leucine-rich repeat protein [Muribaculaceae bacterium]|nr:leucine-rich repeat protein [Muribaculaceae bacterium]
MDRTATYSAPQYLITEIGDSCFAGAQFPNSYPLPIALTRIGNYAFRSAAYAMNNLTLPSGLTYIGTEAFYGTKLTGEIKIPSSVTTIRTHAFYWMLELSSLYFKWDKPINMEDFIWTRSTNNPNLTVWVPNTYASRYVDLVNTWGDEGYSKPLGVWFKPYASSVPFSSVLPTNLSGSNINAYIATAYDKSDPTQQLTMTQVNQAAASTGMIMLGLTANQEYRIKQPTSTVSAPTTNYLVGTPRYAVRIDQQTVGYYWDSSASAPHFIKPTPPSYSNAGEAYLKLSSTEASGMDNVYTNLWPQPTIPRGDINGDNKVDVSDVNIIINIMLGKASASNYPGNADLNNDGKVDVSDVSLLIDVVLGKPVELAEGAVCDLDGDTNVDVTDVSLLIDIVLGKG